jgi:L,D-peptidoglycan transpeptidase YkuD (ErfK/YbiS/YcfS/YnhG family)
VIPTRFKLGAMTLSGLLAVSALVTIHLSKAEAVGRSCPVTLQDAKRLVLVTAGTIDSKHGILQTFERDTAQSPWQAASGPQPAMLGDQGIAWAQGYQSYAQPGEPIQVEGDNRSPAGIFPLGQTFGFDHAGKPLHISLESNRHICVDDLASPYYNQIVSREVAGPGTHAEEMRSIATYRRGIVIDMPTDRSNRTGSCIFLHVWNNEGAGTAGCIGLPENSVEELQDWGGGGQAVIAILPSLARERLRPCLPPV